MTTDLTFITNEEGESLKERFDVLIRDARAFDALVGYFFTSGFHAIYPALENTEKIRILVGISTDARTDEFLAGVRAEKQLELVVSHAEAKEILEKRVAEELEASQDNRHVEEGVGKFIEWARSGKLEIRAYPSQRIHAKLYIVTFREGDRDTGRVITGSSNLTQSGLVDNLEFNVELKNSTDHDFARRKFEELWKDAVDVSGKYVDTIRTKTWLNQDITPHQLYLKFLYEYFKDQLSRTDEVFARYFPANFLKLEYQEQAVLNAKKILEEYGGVFIADVVGLGKTYISTMLAGQLDGRTLVIAAPVLLDPDNPGSWKSAFSDFKTAADFESIGKLDSILKRGTDQYTNVIIDEAHRFRTETNVTYEALAEICRGKRVILVGATPYNNAPNDVLSQIKLFQNARKSTIPNLPNLEAFFAALVGRLKGLDRQADYEEYLQVVKENSREIRERVLKYLMVRRTRTEIVNYFGKDLAKQKLRFPVVAAPQPLYYELNEVEDQVFNTTLDLISTQFSYARYTPLLYLKQGIGQLEEQSQKNMGQFMRVLLVKRLESSFHAFRNSIARFIHSYEVFIKEFEKGNVYTSKKHINKIFEYLEDDDDQAVQQLIDEGKADKYKRSDFRPEFLSLLENDLAILRKVRRLWEKVDRDPKLLELLKQLAGNKILRESKVILFTESKETAEYLTAEVNRSPKSKALCYSGGSGEAVRDLVISNFDAKSRHPKDDYRILISTEVLSEGVNLHRANAVINYDIPWNPTRMMQRVGRINRVDTKFDTIYTFNFFPTRQANKAIKLREAAEAKISAFLSLLGGDAALLTEGEPIGSHELFDRLLSTKAVIDEDDGETSELKYLSVIRDVREGSPDLFEKIKRLPRKARSGKAGAAAAESLVTYFRKGKLHKFYGAGGDSEARELDFVSAAEALSCTEDEGRAKMPPTYFDLLDRNKLAFVEATTPDAGEFQARPSGDSGAKIQRILKAVFKNTKQLTDDQEAYVKRVQSQLEKGALPRQTTKVVLHSLDALKADLVDPRKVLAVLQARIPAGLLGGHLADDSSAVSGRREVILSMYLVGDRNE